jgi:hypothetical protein
MISVKPSKSLVGLLAAAGVLLHAGGALAADLGGDAQQQAADLLSGNGGRAAQTVAVVSVAHTDEFRGDAQDLARQLILGEPTVGGDANQVVDAHVNASSVPGLRQVALDPQESARMFLARGA